jgi:hypothetical protein
MKIELKSKTETWKHEVMDGTFFFCLNFNRKIKNLQTDRLKDELNKLNCDCFDYDLNYFLFDI